MYQTQSRVGYKKVIFDFDFDFDSNYDLDDDGEDGRSLLFVPIGKGHVHVNGFDNHTHTHIHTETPVVTYCNLLSFTNAKDMFLRIQPLLDFYCLSISIF
ncbi:hypothetical protein L2E82_24517 [Cichorium intybus]|uniref:Uncharacterized protein n=1 Tax=Cichorium intybus TaxID=13427 RepID=A0ACB9E0F1_CICIN|nr:hypothetical protein L2E82_24517 [Cichorium intybus]